MTEPGPRVSYELRDVLDRIEKKVDGVASKLDQKADRAQLDALDRRIIAIEAQSETRARLIREHEQLIGRVTALEGSSASNEQMGRYRGSMIRLWISFGGLCAATASVVAYLVTH